MFCEPANRSTSSDVLRASTPWSKSSPRGPDWRVRRLLNIRLVSTRFLQRGKPEETGRIRLGSVNCIKRLVQKEADRPAVVYPGRAVLIERGIIPEKGQEVGDDEHEAGEGDKVRRHARREALDDDIGIEGFEYVTRHQRAVDTRVLVLPKIRQVFLPYVDHDDN